MQAGVSGHHSEVSPTDRHAMKTSYQCKKGLSANLQCKLKKASHSSTRRKVHRRWFMHALFHMLKHTSKGKHKGDIATIRQNDPTSKHLMLSRAVKSHLVQHFHQTGKSQPTLRVQRKEPTPPSKRTSHNMQVSKQNATLSSIRRDKMSHLIKPETAFDWSILRFVRLRASCKAWFHKAVFVTSPSRHRCLVVRRRFYGAVSLKLGHWRC